MSGRALRRLPVLALARYIGSGNIISSGPSEMNGSAGGGAISSHADVDTWLSGMESVVLEQAKQRENLL